MKNMLSRIIHWFRSSKSESCDTCEKPEVDEASVAQIIEQVIDGIDPRLRSMGKSRYAQKLRPAVEAMISYANVACSRIPGPVELTREAWNNDQLVRAIFTSSNDMQRLFSHHQEIRSFFRENPDPDITHAYAVLGMKRNEERVMGMKQHGSVIRRDEPYVNVYFNDYRITHPSADEALLRANLRQRALNECIAQALSKLVEMRNYGNELKEQKLMLEMKLRILEKESSGLTEMMHGEGEVLLKIAEVRDKLTSIKEKYSDIHEEVGTLDSFLDQTSSLLMHPESLIHVESVNMHLDKMNRLIEGDIGDDDKRISLAQVTFSGKDKRVGVLVKFPRQDMMPEEDFLKKAKSLLH
jgi:hypothetical protein